MYYSWGRRGKCCPKFNSVAHEGRRPPGVRDLPSARLGRLRPCFLPFSVVSAFSFHLSLLLLRFLSFSFFLSFFNFLRRCSTNRPAISGDEIVIGHSAGGIGAEARRFVSTFSSSVSSPFRSVFSLALRFNWNPRGWPKWRGRKLSDIGSDDRDDIKSASWNDFRCLNDIRIFARGGNSRGWSPRYFLGTFVANSASGKEFSNREWFRDLREERISKCTMSRRLNCLIFIQKCSIVENDYDHNF